MISEVRPPIKTRALAKRFGSVRALDGLDLTVHAAEVHGFLGPNHWHATARLVCAGGEEPCAVIGR